MLKLFIEYKKMGFIEVSHLSIFVFGAARCRIKIEMQEQASVLHIVPCSYTDTFCFKWRRLVGGRSEKHNKQMSYESLFNCNLFRGQFACAHHVDMQQSSQ